MAKKSKPPKGKNGRPLIGIDWEEFDKLCYMQCTLVEIADWFQCSVDTIERAVIREKKLGFAEYYKKKSCAGKISLRRSMFNKATTEGNVTMMIWLSKQYLGMSDKFDDRHSYSVSTKGEESPVVLIPANGSEVKIKLAN